MRAAGGGRLAAAVVAGTIVWFGASELALPALLMTVALVGLLPPLLFGQASVTEQELREARVVPVYIGSMAVIWILGIGAWAAGRASGLLPSMGLHFPPIVTVVFWTGATTLGALAVATIGKVLGWRESATLEWLLPRTTTERVVFGLLSVSAGIGEELAFRGFLIPALELSSGSRVLAVVISSLAFGMMHSYQQMRGVLRASVLGGLMSIPFLLTGSLIPSMIAHALYDLLAGLWLGEWLLGKRLPRDVE